MTPSDHVAAIVTKALEDAMRDRGRLNVLIAGRTGVGKSTLVNAVFQGRLAENARPWMIGAPNNRKYSADACSHFNCSGRSPPV